MNPNPSLYERVVPWMMQNWEILLSAAIIVFFAVVIRRLLKRATSRPRPLQATVSAPDRPDTQALDVSTAAAAEIAGDIDAYARALFAEDMTTLAARAVANAPQSLRFATIAEAPFVYDGVIMRDLSLLPTALIAPVGNHFRQAQTILDALRRNAALAPPDATPEERVAALKSVAVALAAGLDKATLAAERLDAWLARNGGSAEPPRGLADLPVAALKNAAIDKPGHRAKTYRILREQAQARLTEIDGLINVARRNHGPGAALDMTLVNVNPSDKPAAA